MTRTKTIDAADSSNDSQPDPFVGGGEDAVLKVLDGSGRRLPGVRRRIGAQALFDERRRARAHRRS